MSFYSAMAMATPFPAAYWTAGKGDWGWAWKSPGLRLGPGTWDWLAAKTGEAIIVVPVIAIVVVAVVAVCLFKRSVSLFCALFNVARSTSAHTLPPRWDQTQGQAQAQAESRAQTQAQAQAQYRPSPSHSLGWGSAAHLIIFDTDKLQCRYVHRI